MKKNAEDMMFSAFFFCLKGQAKKRKQATSDRIDR